MDFIEFSQKRKSVRAFKPQEVSQEQLMKLMKAAQAAPSAGNCQPWHFYVIKDKTRQAEIVRQSCQQEFLLTAPVFIVVCADIRRSEARYAERGRNLYCLQDTAAAIQNILLCAASLGLGTCWCGAFDENALSDMLNLADDMRPIAIIPVGYPVSEPTPRKRRPLEEIVTFIGENDAVSVDDNKETSAMFQHCDLSGAEFSDVNLSDSQVNNINFYGVEISDANLSNGKISDCDLSHLSINNCKYDNMTINGKSITLT